MKNKLMKNAIKEIKVARRRFISIALMAMLGVGFFSGLVSSAPDMKESMDKYLDNTNTFDISITSILGFTLEDVDKINNIEDIENAYGIKSKDCIFEIEESDYVAKFIEYNSKINDVVIIEGRNIQNPSECLASSRFMKQHEYKVGDCITLLDDDNAFKNDELTIVGIIQSPIYLSTTSNAGNTNIGKGTLDSYIYTSGDNFNLNYYTTIYANVKGTKELNTDTEEYTELIDKAKLNVESVMGEREKAIWTIQDRTDNTGYKSLTESIESINNLSKVFPIIFYVIAVLISLTSMTRMIEEERIEIGTLKALGYGNSKIMFKYLLYSFLACIIGGVIGMFLTFKLIPSIIWNIYEILYYVPEFVTPFRANYGLIGLLIACICICGATIFASINELRNMPCSLMRPKPPKRRKKSFLRKNNFYMEKIKIFTKGNCKKFI